MKLADTLKKLCKCHAVAGREQQTAEAVAELLRPWCDDVSIDPFGSIVGVRRCGREGAKTVLLDAHLDQIGFVVTEVLEGGFVRFAAVGGVDPRMLLGCEVTILADEPLYGVIACKPPHLMAAGERDKAVEIADMLIDTGLRDAHGLVSAGMAVVFRQEAVQLEKNSLTSKSLDDRAGVAAILSALEKLKDMPLSVDLAVLFSAQEEVTALGAMTSAYRLRPDYAVAVDVSHAKTPDAPAGQTFEFGGGVMIGMGPNMNTALSKALIRTARMEDIAHQVEVMEGDTGTNAWSMQIAAYGAAQAILSIPLRYMHTPIETVRLADIDSVARLLYHFLRNFDGEVRL